MGRQPCCEKVGLKRGPWTVDEDRKLINFILTNRHCCWRAVPKLAGLLRCGKSCRLRWTNYLRPDLKRGLLSESEEQLVIDLHSKLGNRWSKIASHLPGRTDNEIKNLWNTHVKKKLKKMGIDPVTHRPIPPLSPADHHHHQQQQEREEREIIPSPSDDRHEKNCSTNTNTTPSEPPLSNNFCTDEVPMIQPEEFLLPANEPSSNVCSVSASSTSSSTCSSGATTMGGDELQLPDLDWLESMSTCSLWEMDDLHGLDLMCGDVAGGGPMESPLDQCNINTSGPIDHP